MKVILKTIALVIILYFNTLHTNAQSDSKRTVIKIYTKNDKTRYRQFTTGEIKWFNRNGFNTANYDWYNNEINLHLVKAKNSRVRSRFALGFSIASASLSLMSYMGSNLVDRPEGRKVMEQNTKAFLLSSGVLLSTYFVFKTSRKNHLQKANTLR